MTEHMKGKSYLAEFLADFGDMIGAGMLGYQLGIPIPNVSSCIIGLLFILGSIYLKKYKKLV